MITGFLGTAKRNISILMIILLTVVFCGSIDLTCDYFSTGGGIQGSRGISISHSLTAFPSPAVREDNGEGNGNSQLLGQGGLASGFLYRIVKRLLYVLDCGLSRDPLTLIRQFYASICTYGCTCLLLLINVRFIHLKDGSK